MMLEDTEKETSELCTVETFNVAIESQPDELSSAIVRVVEPVIVRPFQ